MRIYGREGDTLEYYSKVFDLPVELIIDSNPHIENPCMIYGEKILIPGYTIEEFKSDYKNLYDRFRLPLDAIILVNNHTAAARNEVMVPRRVTERLINTEKPYDYEKMKADLTLLNTVYPFFNTACIGESVQGREIVEIAFGRGQKVIHYNGAFHANEWITTAVLMRWLNDFLLTVTNKWIWNGLDSMELYKLKQLSIVPMVNPDGVELVHKGEQAAEGKWDVVAMNEGICEFYRWKANIRGVDLNNQFPANWEIEKERNKPKAPSFRDYPGEKFLTEPEAIAMQQLAYTRDFEKVIALHTQGEEFYWGYNGKEPEASSFIASEFAKRSGYKSVRYIDSYAGYKDWFIDTFRRPGFTIEIGKGINPLPLSQFEKAYNDSLGILLASLYM
ncbi:M14 family metallocarboxypeptidase [Peribacillus sp. SCS-155]|uniref:M14 family metallopeptidase n=1 Tax=Peribacillus sedimenti TaxID=3115297 RepID=UPI0039065EA7